MKSLVLGINTAIDPLGFSLVDNTKVVATVSQTATKKWTENISHTIQETCREHGVELSQLSAITVVTGPGTYTGLRIGISCAKSMAEIISCPLYGLNTFEVLANQTPVTKTLFAVVIPGKRGSVSVQLFNGDLEKQACSDPVSMTFQELTHFLNQFKAPLSVVGSMDPMLIENAHIHYVPQRIQTDVLAQWGLKQLNSNTASQWEQVAPFYFYDPVIGKAKSKNV